MIDRLVRWIIRRPGRIGLAWLALAALLAPGVAKLSDRLQSSSTIVGAESTEVDEMLRDRFASPFAEQLVLVVTGLPDVTTESAAIALRLVRERLSDVRGVVGVLAHPDLNEGQLLGADSRGTLVVVGVRPERGEHPDELINALRAASVGATRELQSRYASVALRWIGTAAISQDLRQSSARDARRAELRAFPLTFVLLLVAFGSLVAALLPVAMGVMAIAVSLGVAAAISLVAPQSIMLQSVSSILGIALGVDYSLLMVMRFREALAAGDSSEAAAAVALTKGGRTLLLSGSTVTIGFAALLLMPVPELRSVALGGVLVVTVSTLLATTLVPGVLARLGPRVDLGRFGGPRHERSSPRWERWGAFVARHPVALLIAGGLPLAVLALQAQRLSTTVPSTAWIPADSESAKALDDLRRMAREAVAYRLRLLVEFPESVDAFEPTAWETTLRITRALEADARVAHVWSLPSITSRASLPPAMVALFVPDSVRRHFTSADGRVALIEVEPREGVSAFNVTRLVRDVRAWRVDSLGGLDSVRMRVGGLPAYNVDYEDAVNTHLPRLFLLVIGGTVLALALSFRSILVPIKAVALNLLSVGAAFGAMVLVFQDGHGSSAFGLVTPLDGVFPAVPALVFCIVFGLSMDYEVFLVARVAEARRAGLSEAAAITDGLSRTGPLITRAASVMIVVFATFALGTYLPSKLLGFALAVAVLVDATVVRLALGPALLHLAGHWNWWPGDRWRRTTGTRAK